MIKIVSSQLKSAQNWLDDIRDVDWGDSKPDQFEDPSSSGLVNDDNLEEYLVDNIEPEDQQSTDETGLEPLAPEQSSPEQPIEDYREEIPKGNQLLGIPEDTKEIEYPSPRNLVYDSIENKEVISFEYTNRHGDYAGLRTVEPHYTFVAMSTGNEVLVSYDRDVGDIRAFIVGNIHPNGVRYENVNFQPRSDIMVGVV